MKEITKGMIKGLNESLGWHKQDDATKKVIDYILENIIPMYDTSNHI